MPSNSSTEPYDARLDPDSDPEMMTSKAPRQPNQAEGADDPEETTPAS